MMLNHSRCIVTVFYTASDGEKGGVYRVLAPPFRMLGIMLGLRLGFVLGLAAPSEWRPGIVYCWLFYAEHAV